MTSEKGSSKEPNQNIKVFVRLRPLNQRERDIKSLGVVEVVHNRQVVVRQSSHTTHTKKFTFDRAFGPCAKQVEVYQEVVSPLIEEVLAGYNCTVFAYGQTGTGKTHTMVGEHTGEDTNWQNDPLAGIIPRALSQLFDELRLSNTEYTVRVSYLELYNEELFDLLATSEDNSKLRIYEDRKGSNIVYGLEEITVYNKNEVYKIMAQGQDRRRVASTLMNAQSSRSHTVFTIVVHMKENSAEGEELVKIGKLNLVDLAGSENISKAGSDNPGKKERARECVNINQSLLTLGRVISALVDRRGHIPYRESKLTRILQESLGGRTKTSIIATISPGHKDLEETLSTLEYANRAKNIQNQPEINQKMTKKAILKEYVEEIDKLKRDLIAARDKTGVFLSNETYTELTLEQEEHRKEIQCLLLQKRAMEEEREKMVKVFEDLNQTLEQRATELDATKHKLLDTNTKLANTNNMLHCTKLKYEEQVHLVEKHQATESTLSSQAKELLAAADTATTHVQCLHDSVDRRRHIESANLRVTHAYRERCESQRATLRAASEHVTRSLATDLAALHAARESLMATNSDTLQSNMAAMEVMKQNFANTKEQIKCLTTSCHSSLVEATESHHSTIKSFIESHHGSVSEALASLLQTVADSVLAAESHKLPENVENFVKNWFTSAMCRVECLEASQRGLACRLEDGEARRTELYLAGHEASRAAVRAHSDKIRGHIQELESEKAWIAARAQARLASLEAERKETADRLQQWVEQETAALELRLSKQASEIERERSELESRISLHLQSQHELLEACTTQLQLAEDQLRQKQDRQQESRDTVQQYTNEWGNDVTAIKIDMEAFSQNVNEIVQHMYGQILNSMRQARDKVQNDTKTMTESDKAAGNKLVEDTKAAHTEMLRKHHDSMGTLLSHIEGHNMASLSTLDMLTTSMETLATSDNHHTRSHGASVQEMTSRAETFHTHIREAMEAFEHLEGHYFGEQYKVYCPTGATPGRATYRYPRALAATSPHDRILASFRERRRNHSTGDEDCIVIEDSESRANSDGESSVSEDSAVFAAPSPPAPRDAKMNGIMKCTSESNICDIKGSQEQLGTLGKENADRSLSNGSIKRTSKLRAPTSHKKPLIERNANH